MNGPAVTGPFGLSAALAEREQAGLLRSRIGAAPLSDLVARCCKPLADPAEAATRAMLGIPADALVLGCFGFALAHKGIDTLVETVKPLARASGRAVHLLALNSILDERSERMIQQCQQRARQHRNV